MSGAQVSALDILELSRGAYITRLTTVATLACLSYDYLLTFELERRHIWPTRFSISKIAFLLNRYIPFIAAAGFINVLFFQKPDDLATCKRLFTVFGFATVLGYLIAEFILLYRAYAVWITKKRLILSFLGTFYLVITAVGLFFASRFLKLTTIDNHHLYPIGCVILSPGHINQPPTILVMISETCALALLVAKKKEFGNTALMSRMLSDGWIYYVVAIFASMANLIVFSTTSDALCNALLVTQVMLHSICCNRLLLGIRSVNDSLSHTASLFSSPGHSPNVRPYLYHMASASRYTRSIKFAHSPGSSSTSPGSPTDFPLSPISPSSLSSPSSQFSPFPPGTSEISEIRV